MLCVDNLAMSITDNYNAAATRAYSALDRTTSALDNTFAELSSGLQIHTAANNPAGYVSAGLLGDQANGYGVDITNAQNDISMLRTVQGALNKIITIIEQMQQLAYSSANSATTDQAAMEFNNQEYQALQRDITRITISTRFGPSSFYVFFLSGTFQVGTGTSSYSQLPFSINTNEVLSWLTLSSTDISTQADATSALTHIAAALQAADNIQSYLGAQQNELQKIVSNLVTGRENLRASQSRIVDANFA